MTKYKVTISEEAIDYRIKMLEIIDSVKITREGEALDFILECATEDVEAVEYELRKAERRDDFCEWVKEIS